MMFVIICFVQVGVAYGEVAGFKDVPETAWYKGNLTSMSSKGIISGYGNGNFGPKDTLTKAQYITMLVRLSGGKAEKVEGKWWQGYVDKATEMGLLRGKDEVTDIETYISRGQMAKYTERILSIMGEEITPDLYIEKNIKDYSLQDEKEAILKCYAAGIITGYPDGTFKGHKELTRAEALVVLDRILNKEIRKPVVNEPMQKKYAKAVEEERASKNVEWKDGKAIITSMYGKENATYLEPGSISTEQIPNVHEIIKSIQSYFIDNSDYVVMTQHQKGVYHDTLDHSDISIGMANNIKQYLRGVSMIRFQIYDRGLRNGEYETDYTGFSENANIFIYFNYQARKFGFECLEEVIPSSVIKYMNEAKNKAFSTSGTDDIPFSRTIEGYQVDYFSSGSGIYYYISLPGVEQ